VKYGWIVLLLASLTANGTRAETLQDALIAAYKTNPDLQAQRARLRVTDETYVQTLSQFGPTVSYQIQSTYDRDHLSKSARNQARASTPNLPDYSEQNSYSGQLVISQPLYTGGRLSADLKAADAQVRAGREALRTTEANVLYSTILAYADLLRDQEDADIRKLNLDMLQHQVDEAQARQKAGEVTRTDVAQAQAQLASEEALYQAALGQVDIDATNYAATVGYQPGRLAPLPELVGTPTSLEKVLAAGERDNPDLQQALFVEEESHAKIYSARSALRPSASLQIQDGEQGPLAPFDNRDLNRGLGVTASVVIPLYSNGLARSQTRQAIDQDAADAMTVDEVRRTVIKNLSTLWVQRRVALAAVDTQARQVEAAKIAFEGMRKEYTAGERSTLDVLVAEETLRDAELALVSARHDAYMAGAALLQNMGWLEIRNLVVTDDLYPATAHLHAIMPKIRVPWQTPLQKLDSTSVPKIQTMAAPSVITKP